MTVPEHAVHYLEIVTPNVEAACRLYGKCHGWQFQAKSPELGNAVVAVLPGGSLCGIRAPLHDQEKSIVRTYVRVADVKTAVEEAAALGAHIALEPTELPGHGRIAIDLFGGVEQGLWHLP